jgi:hypothetical protein
LLDIRDHRQRTAASYLGHDLVVTEDTNLSLNTSGLASIGPDPGAGRTRWVDDDADGVLIRLQWHLGVCL